MDRADSVHFPAAASSAEVIHDFNYAQIITLDLLAKGYVYLEVPISYHFRTTGESFIKLFPLSTESCSGCL